MRATLPSSLHQEGNPGMMNILQIQDFEIIPSRPAETNIIALFTAVMHCKIIAAGTEGQALDRKVVRRASLQFQLPRVVKQVVSSVQKSQRGMVRLPREKPWVTQKRPETDFTPVSIPLRSTTRTLLWSPLTGRVILPLYEILGIFHGLDFPEPLALYAEKLNEPSHFLVLREKFSASRGGVVPFPGDIGVF